jgi:hypothetical protein
MMSSGENTMCLPAVDEMLASTPNFTSIPTDVEEIIALQERIDDLEWERACEFAHEAAMKWLDEHGF